MALDARVRRLLDLLAAAEPADARGLSVAARRASLLNLMKFSASPEPTVRVEEGSLPGPAGPLRTRLYAPDTRAAGVLPVLIYFHGGGFVAGSIETHDGIARALAAACACRVLSVEYRLAPEAPFPAAIEDAEAAIRHVTAHPEEFAADPTRIGVCGDSAGATLATVAFRHLALTVEPRLALQLLLCPIADYGSPPGELAPSHSRREFAQGYLVDEATLEHDLAHYLPPTTARSDPRVSPLRAVPPLPLPCTLIHTAEYDPLRDDARRYAEGLAAAGTPVSYTCHPGMIHLFYGLGRVIPYAQVAFARMGREVRAIFEPGEGGALAKVP